MTERKTSPARGEGHHVDLILRATEILECFTPRRSELTLTELSNLTGLQKSKLLRLCGTLASKGHLKRDAETLKYSLGPRLMVLGRLYENANSLFQLSKPIIKELAHETKETVSLFVVHGSRRLCLVKEDGEQPIRFVNAEGDILDIHRGAGGVALLAFLDEETRGRVVEDLIADPANDLPQSWAKDREQEFAEVRRKGYAIGFGSVIPGVAAIGVPVFDASGSCCASISVAGPIDRFTEDRCPILIRQMLDASSRLSADLGYARHGED
jgi:DNA-binding IclR family transcriptional regulator